MTAEARPPKLLDRVRRAIRVRHHSPRTGGAYVRWIRRSLVFHGRRHPSLLGPDDASRFVSALATRGRVSASTQTQALGAILFPNREVLRQPLAEPSSLVRAKQPGRVPVVQRAVRGRSGGPGSRSPRPVTPSGTRSPPTRSRTATTSGPCRSCWATPT